MNAGLTEFLGYAAAGLVLATFSVRSITALRSVAIASNLLFIAYAAYAELHPVLILHVLLLPINLVRLRQALASTPCTPTIRHHIARQPCTSAAAVSRSRSPMRGRKSIDRPRSVTRR